jgi:hypothetical protein
MSELYSNDPLITWAAVWVARQEAAAAPCRRCRRRRMLAWAVGGLILAAGIAMDTYIAAKFGWL